MDKTLRNRYSRQTSFPGIGDEGQEKLLRGKVVVIGCGGLGCNIAVMLVRAGVGAVKIIDRDFVEVHNLNRQVLFDEADVGDQIPKAVAAARHLKKINSTVEVEGIVADVNTTNIERFCAGADVILDGLDNFETRFLINDAALKLGIPWVYGGAVGAGGMTMTIIPGTGPCLRCMTPVLPVRGTLPTCETAGVIGPAPAIIGDLQAAEALKLLVGDPGLNRGLLAVDVWKGNFNRFNVERRPDCPACNGKYEYLDQAFTTKATSLCGQSRSVQVVDSSLLNVDLDRLAGRLGRLGQVTRKEYELVFTAADQEIIVFPDGRAIIKNLLNEAAAVGLYQKYVKDFISPDSIPF